MSSVIFGGDDEFAEGFHKALSARRRAFLPQRRQIGSDARHVWPDHPFPIRTPQGKATQTNAHALGHNANPTRNHANVTTHHRNSHRTNASNHAHERNRQQTNVRVLTSHHRRTEGTTVVWNQSQRPHGTKVTAARSSRQIFSTRYYLVSPPPSGVSFPGRPPASRI
jgi:hypothetical protein